MYVWVSAWTAGVAYKYWYGSKDFVVFYVYVKLVGGLQAWFCVYVVLCVHVSPGYHIMHDKIVTYKLHVFFINMV